MLQNWRIVRSAVGLNRRVLAAFSALLRPEKYGLRARLVAIVVSLLLFSMFVPGYLLYKQHQVSSDSARISARASDRMIESVEAREVLRNVQRLARREEADSSEVASLADLAQKQDADTRQALLSYIDVLAQRASSGSYAPLDGAYSQAMSLLELEIEREKATVFRLVDEQEARESRMHQTGVLLMTLAGLVFIVLGYKVTALVTRPVQALIGFLDQVDLEQELPGAALASGSKMPEVSRLATAFDRFVGRIRGYRALNIQRILIEKHRADLIAKSIFDGIFLLRGDELVFVNPVGEKILGISESGRKRWRISTSGSEGLNVAAVRAIESAVTRTLPVEFSMKVEDRVFHYLLQARPVMEPEFSGEEDALEREMSELALMEPDVEGKYPNALNGLRTSMLIVAQDVTIVRESQDAKGHFLATLSHEIKTPVTSLTMATRLLRRSVDQVPNPSHRSLIVTCSEDVDRLRSLLSDLLNISSFDTLTQRLEIQSVDMGRLVKQSVQTFKPQAREKAIELTCEVSPVQGRPIIAPVDPTKIAWAVSNLLTNALRHTPRGGSVAMSVQVVEGRAEVRVRDTGPGIDRKRQARIFDKFNSHYDIRVGRSGGAGVGLAIAREIVVAHQGRIWVSSESGKGAEFGFALPLAKRTPGLATDGSDGIAGADQADKKGALSGASAGC